MGLIKAATSMVGGGLADQWLEVIEPDNMSDTTVMTKGVKVRKDDKRGSNRKGTEDVLTDGTVVHVYPNMMMLLSRWWKKSLIIPLRKGITPLKTTQLFHVQRNTERSNC